MINSSRFGLSSYIFTDNEMSKEYFIRNLKVGVVHINDYSSMVDSDMVVNGRKLSSKILYNSRYAFDCFLKLKSVKINF